MRAGRIQAVGMQREKDPLDRIESIRGDAHQPLSCTTAITSRMVSLLHPDCLTQQLLYNLISSSNIQVLPVIASPQHTKPTI